jgi:carboxylesterase
MRKIYFLVLFPIFFSCNPTPEIDDTTMLDGNQIFDLSLTQPEDYLVSEYITNPTEEQKNTPVLIAAHGYTATTFEWDEFREYADEKGTFFVSQVLLGGHGRTYADFKASSWEDWQSSIKEEYIKLSNKGFKNIYLAGSSTGAPLIIHLLSSGFFKDYTRPKGIFLIDPIVVSSNKTLTMVGLLGPILGYTSVDLSTGEVGKWYVYRPQETLKQLMKLIDMTRINLEKGILITPDIYVKVYKSKVDDTADPVSAVMIYKGIKFDSQPDKTIDVQMVNSSIHVFTRLKGREGVTDADTLNQQEAFDDMSRIMTE